MFLLIFGSWYEWYDMMWVEILLQALTFNV